MRLIGPIVSTVCLLYVPALQVQAASAVLAPGELELPGHAIQVDSSVAPAVGEYFPAAQFTHALATL